MRCIAFLSVVLAAVIVRAGEREPVSVIFDTDIMGDVDDVGAVAVLHALADRGEAKILAMGVCVKNPRRPLCLDALNTYFGRAEVPLGVVKGPAHNRASKYAQAVAEEFPHALRSADDAPDAALLCRQGLADQPEREHLYLVKTMPPEKIAAVIEELMLRPPAKKPEHDEEMP